MHQIITARKLQLLRAHNLDPAVGFLLLSTKEQKGRAREVGLSSLARH